jgi:single-stranded DNA-binding protein
MSSIKGNVGKDPLEFTIKNGKNAGKTFAKFSMAVSGKSKTDKPTWYTVLAFGKLAGPVLREISKGQRLLVKGDTKTEDWTNPKTNETVEQHSIFADEIELPDGTIISKFEAEETTEEVPF